MLRFLPTLGLMALLPLAACTMYGAHPVQTFSDATGGEGLEKAFWRDLKQRDWKDLDRHIASNFIFVTGTERLERGAAFDRLQHMQILEYSIGDLTTEMSGDTFVVSYTITLDGSVQGQGFPDQPQRCMTVWHREKSGWLAIAHTELGALQR
jgi:Domain of unknown function (DUF4440)